MFTGLVEATGTLCQLETLPEGGMRLWVTAPDFILDELALGDSIALDGACTTVVTLEEMTNPNTQTMVKGFTIDASPETLSKTVMGKYVSAQRINLERPLLPSTRLGGHFVTGHVDGTATLIEKYPEGNSWIFRFSCNQPELLPYLVQKGSVTVNGISLTVNRVDDPTFTVAIIPYTLEHTTLGDCLLEDTVNIETDLLGKYVHRFSQYFRPDHAAAVAPVSLI